MLKQFRITRGRDIVLLTVCEKVMDEIIVQDSQGS